MSEHSPDDILSERDQKIVTAKAVLGYIKETGVDEFADHPEDNAHVLGLLAAPTTPEREAVIKQLVKHVRQEAGISELDAYKLLMRGLIRAFNQIFAEEDQNIDEGEYHG